LYGLPDFFITHPGNRGRKDLRCSLGCRDHHNKEEARKRSAEYYQTEEGKEMKKKHNRRRYERKDPKTEPPPPVNMDETDDEDFIEHLDFMMSLTEGKKVGSVRMREIYQDFFKKWRQRGLSYWQKWCKLPEQ